MTHLVHEFERDIESDVLKKTFDKCFFNTIHTTTFFDKDESVFVLTGDIPAMWLRDSAAQVMQYLFFAKKCEEVRALIKGVLKRQFTYLLIDPYANAFNRAENGHGHAHDLPKQSPWVWERKFEIDSMCYPFFLAARYYDETQDDSIFDELFLQAFDEMMKIFAIEQDHAAKSEYYHEIPTRNASHWCGKGTPVSGGGLVWSGYRPSDDKCSYGYYIPGNMFLCSVLFMLAPIFEKKGDESRAALCRDFITVLKKEIEEKGVTEIDGKKIYALETDGLGSFNIMDDANIPNLLAIPYYRYPFTDEEIYKNTRAFILSEKNPYYFKGKCLTGVGSPHTPKNYVWPLSLIIQALTTDDEDEVRSLVDMIVANTDGTGYIHEGVDKDDPSVYTRPWFAWANSLFAYLILAKRECFIKNERARKGRSLFIHRYRRVVRQAYRFLSRRRKTPLDRSLSLPERR